MSSQVCSKSWRIMPRKKALSALTLTGTEHKKDSIVQMDKHDLTAQSPK